ncbi:hypothetical protein SASPL_154583 [Salvia splendens]|uniref:DELLA protein n=1 Tax=Salvia splendens TaxID=180675 RepID=A0A8X8W0C6_SALSN|nr:hypothetical protein SASPL_154583 [Salvia splendens]
MQKASQEGLACPSVHNSHLLPSKSQDTELSFQAYAEPFYTLESTPVTGSAVFSSPTATSVSSNKSPFSPLLSQSYVSDIHHSSDNSSSLNGSFDSLWLLGNESMGPECGSVYNGSSTDESAQPCYSTRYHRIVEMASNMDLKQLLIACAEVISEADIISFSERCDVQLENLNVQHGEALAVNFAYVLHHIPDESVSTSNHRDCLLRLVKSMFPKVMTLVEQESNTNTATFSQRFRETLDYYAAMFECIDTAALARDDMQRINAEEHCVAKDVVSIIACEGNERMERHEVFGKWRDMLKEYSPSYGLADANDAVYIGWKNKALVSFSGWR